MTPVELEKQIATLLAERERATEPVVIEALDAKIASLEAELLRLRLLESKAKPEALEEGPRELSTDDRREFDAAVARLRLLVTRGDWAAVEKGAASLTTEYGPQPELFEAQGDLFAAKKRPEKAKEAYGRALSLRPHDVGLEKKHAQTVYTVANLGSLEDGLRSGVPGGALLDADPMARAGVATFLSLLFPGVGQIVLGEVAKGAAMFLVWGTAMTYMAVNAAQFRGFLSQLGLARGGNEPSGLFYLAFGVALLTLVIAVFDCAARTKTTVRREVARPTPPVNLPFE